MKNEQKTMWCPLLVFRETFYRIILLFTPLFKIICAKFLLKQEPYPEDTVDETGPPFSRREYDGHDQLRPSDQSCVYLYTQDEISLKRQMFQDNQHHQALNPN